MQQTLFFVTALLLVAARPTAPAAPAVDANGEADGAGDRLAYTLKEICTQSGNTFFLKMPTNQDLFKSWIHELNRIPGPQRRAHYFHSRPHDTPPNSVCQPMNTTCCRLSAEKQMVKLAKREYGELFMNITQESLRSCFVIGRFFYHAVYLSFVEMRRWLEIPINDLFDGKLEEGFFNDFFGYLNSFLVQSDLCELPQQLKLVMVKLFDFAYEAQQGDRRLRFSHGECYRNVSMQIMESVFRELFNKLERQLYNLDLIFRAMQISETVIEKIKQHHFSPECTKPLTQVQYCGKCTGFYRFKPCLFYCMNVFRGCFADIADVQKEFQLMTRALSDIPDEVLPMFQPAAFIQESLHYFVDLATDLRERDLKAEVEDTCTSNSGNPQRKRSIPSQKRSSVASTQSPNYDTLTNAFNRELQCMRSIGSLLGTIPEKMCYLSKEYETIADSGNHRCWTGNNMGSYYHAMTGASKEAQVNNPVFRGTILPFSDQYVSLNMDISVITAEINETLDIALCLDDEDCTAPPYYICDVEEPSGSGEIFRSFSSGSGSGSGSGSSRYIDDAMRDMEDGDTSQSDIDEETPAISDPSVTNPTPETDNSGSGMNATNHNEPTDEGYTVIDITKSGSGGNASTTGDNTTNETLTPQVTPPGITVDIKDDGDKDNKIVGGGVASLHQSTLKAAVSFSASLLLFALV